MSASDCVMLHPRTPRFTTRAFGLLWSSDWPLPQFAPASECDEACDVTVDRLENLGERAGGRRINNGEVFKDGARFCFGDTVFDTFGDSRVTWWSPKANEIPFAFYGTVTAIILAWRRLVPLHASAVAFDGKAILIAGPAGAGKSTLCNALIDKGGRLVSDDLSALIAARSGSPPTLLPGRPAIRLAVAGSDSPRDKKLHEAPMVDPLKAVELNALVLLRDTAIPPGAAEAAELLRQQLFRPRWMRALPYPAARAATILHAAFRIRMIEVPPATSCPELAVQDKAELILGRLVHGGHRNKAAPIVA